MLKIISECLVLVGGIYALYFSYSIGKDDVVRKAKGTMDSQKSRDYVKAIKRGMLSSGIASICLSLVFIVSDYVSITISTSLIVCFTLIILYSAYSLIKKTYKLF
ncbi:hypothetical protein [Clostridium cylindrosporum]|uniref:DUF3784 domain-containing protein n=1 Tax=Clostridium cylindrosporum DSM 605 TaxID=1121307 RepID=A0A0J8DGN7_CLOCY|nr:hypothetical protein [Clostridium cylindrosporum]KMT23353.1 hypothetical protein CLCY_8c00900 [Clostridium cylindrosporum DSM 605]